MMKWLSRRHRAHYMRVVTLVCRRVSITSVPPHTMTNGTTAVLYLTRSLASFASTCL